MSSQRFVLASVFLAILSVTLAKTYVDWQTKTGFKYQNSDKAEILTALDKVEIAYGYWVRGETEHRMVTVTMKAKTCEINYIIDKSLIRIDSFINQQVALGYVTEAEADQVREQLEKITKAYLPQVESFLSQVAAIVDVDQMPSDPAAAEKTMKAAFKGYRETLSQVVDGLYKAVTDEMKAHFDGCNTYVIVCVDPIIIGF
ncbi:hypothetical protein HDE_04334 [Halotydeus destructor]|nr:hypothetical protein HDE_04334 [Halotydeus destructor]